MATRIVRLDIDAADESGWRPLGVRIFHNDTIYWIRTRVVPGVSMKGLLHHLLGEIESRGIARLPVNLFYYSIFEMSREMTLMPDLSVEYVAGPVLFLHESEFVNAFDRERRLMLIADMVRQVEKHLPPERTADRMEESQPDVTESQNPRPVPASRGRTKAVPQSDGGGWASWQRMVG